MCVWFGLKSLQWRSQVLREGGGRGGGGVRLGPGANMLEIKQGLHHVKISSKAGCDVPQPREVRKPCGEAPYLNALLQFLS